MKSNIFDFNRFGLLVRKRFLDSKSSTIYEILGLAAVLAIIFGLIATTGSILIVHQTGVLGVGIVILGIVYADRAFSETKGKLKGMAFLATPASQLEKLLNAILYTSVLFPIVFSLIFLAVDGLFYAAANATGIFSMENIFSIDGLNFAETIRNILIVQSVYMLGSIWFGKRSLLKTTLAVVLFYGVIFAVAGIIIRMNYELLKTFSESSNGVNVHWDGNDIIRGQFMKPALWLLPPFFWTVAYFRLSEKQI
ncbi:hypothetical protein [Acetobacteroides hydrogenigenes]|uniref:ABC-2 family transporter n=1 Tax=Acetobacteroides hydrogenigenes TaxID=979970 RepID=A0A4V2RQ48_9BACT|nr:hypothetical protein [Acetobacteroides hydrogenigenes]TCN70190.1 hypothetical protein CLV25_104145 [Acetobacteroides hydrogenigenes]